MSFSALKKQSNLNALLDEFQKQSSPETKSFDDDRFWKPEMDKSGNGFAVIRFLPAPEGEEIPWIRMFSHSFRDQADGTLRIVSLPSIRMTQLVK